MKSHKTKTVKTKTSGTRTRKKEMKKVSTSESREDLEQYLTTVRETGFFPLPDNEDFYKWRQWQLSLNDPICLLRKFLAANPEKHYITYDTFLWFSGEFFDSIYSYVQQLEAEQHLTEAARELAHAKRELAEAEGEERVAREAVTQAATEASKFPFQEW